ncbi:MAG: AraC family transcriptional regulator [Turicibacter bilis]|nr:AraC family transcriptional regulator [Turicibacter bilis]
MTNIAKGVGYNNPFAFSKIFRKHKGMSPSQYRNEQQKKPRRLKSTRFLITKLLLTQELFLDFLF